MSFIVGSCTFVVMAIVAIVAFAIEFPASRSSEVVPSLITIPFSFKEDRRVQEHDVLPHAVPLQPKVH